MRILLTPGFHAGHLLPFLGLARDLVARGHQVLFAAEPGAVAPARRAGCKVLRGPAVGQFMIEHADTVRQAAAATRVARRSAPHLLRLAGAHRVDLLVVDHMHLGAALAAARSGLPWATLSTTPVLFSPIFRDWPSLLATDAIRRDLGLPPSADDSLRQALSPSLVLMPWIPTFDLAPPPPQAVHVGPLAPASPARPAATARRRAAAPRVLVSLSTSPQRALRVTLRRFVATMVDVLAELELSAVLTVGDVEVPRRARHPAIQVRSFADHDQLMPRADLVVTHGGWGTLGRALRHGVPTLTVPFERDQFANAQAFARHGLGLAVPPDEVDADTLRSAVADLLSTTGPFRARLAGIARTLRASYPQQRAADAVLALGGEP